MKKTHLKKQRIFNIMGCLVILSFCLISCAPSRQYRSRLAQPNHPNPTENFANPLKTFTVLSPFGKRGRRFHTGIDIRQNRGAHDPVLASRTGRVDYVGALSGYGNIISIQHNDGFSSRYAHLHKILVKNGQWVTQGQKIGLVGRTGRATTEHLHFEILTPRKKFLDPGPYLLKK